MSAAKTQPNQSKLNVENLTELFTNVPQTPWVLGGVLPESSIVMVSGLGHTSKTFLALDACAAVASGTAWLGHFPTRQGVALYVGEDSGRADITRQMRKLLIGRGLTSDPPSEDMLFAVCQGASLNTEQQAQRVAELIFRTQPRLVVLDSLRYLTPGKDEDSSTDMGQVMDFIKGLRDIVYADDGESGGGPAILLIHHNSLGNRPRGSTAIFDAVDGAINLRVNHKKGGQIEAKIEKRRCIEVPDFAYLNLWDLDSTLLEFVQPVEKETNEEGAILALLNERKTISTADATACVKANTKNGEELSSSVISNRTARLLQKLKSSGKVLKTDRGTWFCPPKKAS